MRPSQDRTLAIGLRLYRALARAFPYEFRNAYGEEMIQVTEEAVEPVWRRHGIPGLLRLLVDIAIRIPVEHWAELRQDVRYGLRMLAASPGFTAVALISLTLGIGVATSAFSEMNGFVLRDVPGVRGPDDLVMVKEPISYPDYRRYRERTDLFSGTLAYLAPVPFGVSIGERAGQNAARVWGHLVTPSYFATLDAVPALGRVFEERNERPGQAPEVVVSYRFWQDRLASDPAAIGRMLRVNGQPCRIVGVGPKEFLGASPMLYAADLWIPIWADARVAPELATNPMERRSAVTFHMVARLRPGVTAARAEAALDAIARQLEQYYGDPDRNRPGRRIALHPGGKMLPLKKDDLPFLTSFFTLLGGMILLIASSNVANMMLARATDRRREIAVRLALGASRARLVRQLLTECMLVAAGAGALGFLMAEWVMHLGSQLQMPFVIPVTFNLQPDTRVLMFTIGLTALTALGFGLLPALQATRTDLAPALKEGGNVRLPRFRRLSLRNALVVAQVAGSLGLLLITGFLVLGHRRIASLETGFDPHNLYMVSLDPVRDGYSGEQATAVFHKLLDRIQSLPMTRSATLTSAVPMSMIGRPAANFSVDSPGGTKEIHSARRFVVGREFLATTGIALLRGRNFTKEDEASDSIAAIVNERLAQDCWPGQNPLGQRMEIGEEDMAGAQFSLPSPGKGPKRAPRLVGNTRVAEVVGVVKNIRDGLDLAPKQLPAIVFLPLRPADLGRPSLGGIALMLRATPGIDAIGTIRREIAALDDKLTPFHARSMPQQIDELMFAVWAALWTYGFIGIFGLILASVGLAGVTAYSVAQRRREIGIRMALGARGIDALGLVMKEGAMLVLVGSVIGLAFARAGMRMLAIFMSDVARITGSSTSEPILQLGAPLLLAALALAACYVPARKSMRVDPAVALRAE